MWLKYFEQYASEQLPLFLQAKPWNYKNDICMLGLKKLADVTGNRKWSDYIIQYSSYLINEDGKVDNWYENEKNSDKVSFGKSLKVLYDLTKDQKYNKAVFDAYKMLEDYPRTETGNFWHKDIYPDQVWLDGFYMVMPFYAQSLIDFNEDHWDDIFNQFQSAHRLLWNDELKLYMHANDCSKKSEWCDKTTGKSQVVWLRAVGWFFMSLVDTYEISNNKTSRSQELVGILKNAADHIMQYIDSQSNMFLQIVDGKTLVNNYLETSGSAMIAYALMKGARLGILDEKYGLIGNDIVDGIKKTYLVNNEECFELNGICASAGLGPGPDNRTDRDGTPEYYLREKQMTDNQHGAAACMMAVSEQLLRSN
ncbi:glycoside hydrolase family 105 protein [Proteiniclasticum sp. C24MP]|uniref:glycoside hydrolase family 88/105 protein n=1 Tax=Proteiniclasticum sp. C24MP TaxID=3374101 RepID=UPI003754B715